MTTGCGARSVFAAVSGEGGEAARWQLLRGIGVDLEMLFGSRVWLGGPASKRPARAGLIRRPMEPWGFPSHLRKAALWAGAGSFLLVGAAGSRFSCLMLVLLRSRG